MREIKFRAWDGTRMYEVEKLVVGEVSYPDEVKGYNIWGDNKTLMNLMQYTGLKDKNGKEIYEGDILNVNSNGVVEWNNELVGFITSDRNPNKPFYNILWASLVREGLAEIIGNIYENPELLTTNT